MQQQPESNKQALSLDVSMTDAFIVAAIRQALARGATLTILPVTPQAGPAATSSRPLLSHEHQDSWPKALFVGHKDVIAAEFRAGDGVLGLSAEMPDEAIVASVRCAMSHAQPFQILPGITRLVLDEWSP